MLWYIYIIKFMEENDFNDIEKKQAAFVADLLERGKQRNIENLNSIIGYNIKKHRKRQRLTQEQLGKRIGKTTSSIQKYEAGKTEIPRSVLEDIASALNLHLLDILDDTSAFEWYDARDNAIISLLASLGCKVNIGIKDIEDTSLHYKGHDYMVSTSDLLHDFFDDIEDNTEYQLKKFIKRCCSSTADTKSKE